jgi:hypothetical protein
MTKKIYCTVTKNIYYLTEKRYARLLARYGNEESLKTNFVSLNGKRLRDGVIENHIPQNRIRCKIANTWHYITNERIKAGIVKYGTWEAMCSDYTSRVAARLLRHGKTIEEIRSMADRGELPEK